MTRAASGLRYDSNSSFVVVASKTTAGTNPSTRSAAERTLGGTYPGGKLTFQNSSSGQLSWIAHTQGRPRRQATSAPMKAPRVFTSTAFAPLALAQSARLST